jgi:hypothetical protein
MAWFYEIRSSDEAVLKRDCGFANPDAAKIAAREEVRNSWEPSGRLHQARVGSCR